MKNSLLSLTLVLICIGFSHSAQSQNDQANPPRNQEGERGRPTVEELFNRMDENKDDHLSKAEIKGPLSNDFDRVDTNGDGLISREELENAPKPERGQRPPRN